MRPPPSNTQQHTRPKTLNQLKGDLFKKLIRSGGVLDEAYVAAEVILPLLLTLEYLHAHRIFHR